MPLNTTLVTFISTVVIAGSTLKGSIFLQNLMVILKI